MGPDVDLVSSKADARKTPLDHEIVRPSGKLRHERSRAPTTRDPNE